MSLFDEGAGRGTRNVTEERKMMRGLDAPTLDAEQFTKLLLILITRSTLVTLNYQTDRINHENWPLLRLL